MTSPPTQPLPSRPNLVRRLLPVILVLLLIAAVANWRDIAAVAGGKKTLWSVVQGKRAKESGSAWSFPPPAGLRDAKVRVDVIAQEGSCCQRQLVALWLGISDLEPKRLRVEFVGNQEMGRVAPKGKLRPLEIGTEAGVQVDGQNRFVVGSGKARRTTYLSGPFVDPNLAAGKSVSPDGHGWTCDDLADIVNRAIERRYGQPAHLTGAAIAEAGRAADHRIPPPKPAAPREAGRGR